MCKADGIRVKSAATTFEVIDALKSLEQPDLSEITEYLDVPKSSVYDYLSTLIELELVIKEDEGYRLGARFLEYGGYIREQMKVYHLARPAVNRLADKTGGHANLMVEEHGLGIFLYKAKGENAVNLDTHPGMRVPLQTTALGKTILAHMTEEKVREVVEKHGLPEVTNRTITDYNTLLAELDRVRDQEYATDDEERVEGMRCVAAPVLDQNDDVIAAVSVSGPVSRMDGEHFEDDIPRRVLSAANVIEVNMTYS